MILVVKKSNVSKMSELFICISVSLSVQLSDDQNIFDEVDEATYSKIVRKRQDDDWIVDGKISVSIVHLKTMCTECFVSVIHSLKNIASTSNILPMQTYDGFENLLLGVNIQK